MITFSDTQDLLPRDLNLRSSEFLGLYWQTNIFCFYNDKSEELLLILSPKEIQRVPLKDWKPYKLANQGEILILQNKKTPSQFRLFSLYLRVVLKDLEFKGEITDLIKYCQYKIRYRTFDDII